MLALLYRLVRLRRMADDPNVQQLFSSGRSLSPAEEAGPDLPSRDGVPNWVPVGREERWRNSVLVAQQLFPGDPNSEAVWQSSRVIYNDEANYPD